MIERRATPAFPAAAVFPAVAAVAAAAGILAAVFLLAAGAARAVDPDPGPDPHSDPAAAGGAEGPAMAILESRCLSCHSGESPEGGLSLVDAAAATGGDGGAALVPGSLESPLWTRVAAGEMPPDGPLEEDEREVLRAWIVAGAPWPAAPLDPLARSTATRAGRDWWSLQPVRDPPLPAAAADAWVRGPIDAFVLERLRAEGLAPSSPADPRTLVRRLHLDLVGLPAAPEVVEAFVADPSDAAYERLVDGLLASPHHGERWGRHWLDVVRYTESEGFEYDHPRDRAWHYRDWVIRSLNADMPYDRFMREQIAGDVLEPVTSDGIVATSLLVCGAWDRAGNNQSNVAQRLMTREEEMEDMLSVVGQTFLGLTLNCARCHGHKFDPVPQEDYFRVKAVFDGVKHGERPILPPDAIAARERRAAERRGEQGAVRAEIAAIEHAGAVRAAARDASGPAPGPVPLVRWTFDDPAAPPGGRLHGGATIADGRLRLTAATGAHFESDPIPATIGEKTLEAWVVLPELDQGGGAAISIENTADRDFDAIVFGERQRRKWIAGSGGFARTHDLDAAEESVAGRPVHMAAVYRADGSIGLYRDGTRYAAPYVPGSGLRTFERGAATVLIGLRHHGAGNGFLEGEILQAALHDRALSDDEVAAAFRAGPEAVPRETILAALDDTERARHAAATARLGELAAEEATLAAAPEVSYVGVRVEPPPTALLRRGDPGSPGPVLAPAGLSAIRAVPADLGLPPDAPEAERRRRFADWIADPANPLPARVIVNRLWQYHFGRGIVATPSDFGKNGAPPTHPELLDWLAADLVRGGWRLKPLHRRIVLSATYRQSSAFDEAAAARDADATLLWRYPPRRLEAEVVRDAMLAVSGALNPAIGGPSFRPFTTTNFNATFYHPVDRDEPEFNRRTVYRMNVNSGKEPLLEAFDCPSPAVKTPVRGETITPLQALSLMNNSFVRRQAERLAARAADGAGGDTSRAVDRAWALTLGRPPSADERRMAVAAAGERGLAGVCWALLNSSEFLYVR